jgi:hypothetical protein
MVNWRWHFISTVFKSVYLLRPVIMDESVVILATRRIFYISSAFISIVLAQSAYIGLRGLVGGKLLISCV